MKLKELKYISLLNEGRVDPNVLLSISNIIKNNKVTDSFQYLMLYRIIELIKYGKFESETNFYQSPETMQVGILPSQVEILSLLKALPVDQIVVLASKFHELLVSKNLDTLQTYCNVEQNLSDWINFVTSKEAND